MYSRMDGIMTMRKKKYIYYGCYYLVRAFYVGVHNVSVTDTIPQFLILIMPLLRHYIRPNCPF